MRHPKIKIKRNSIHFMILLSLSLFSIGYAKSILDIQHWQTETATPIYFVKAPQIPMVDILVAFSAGSNRDGNQFGLANLTGSLIGEATQTLTADQIADKMDDLGMIFDVKTNRDMTFVHLRSLTETKYLQPSLQLFEKLLAQATFPESVFKRVQNNMLQAVTEQQQDPGQIANNAFAQLIFSGSAYAHPTIGSRETISALTANDVENFYTSYYVAQNAIIVIVGDLTNTEAKNIGDRIAHSLLKGKPAKPLPLVLTNQPKSEHLAFPADQTTIRLGEVGVLPIENIKPALIVGNYILGSGLTSLLFKTVRNQYGLSYSIGSYFIPLSNRGAFIVALETKNAQTQEAIKVTEDVIKNYLKTGPNAQELQAAKDYLIGSFPLTIESNADIANYVLTTAFYHLPLDYLDNYKKNINAVTAAEVKQTMAEYINPKNFVIVTVGK